MIPSKVVVLTMAAAKRNAGKLAGIVQVFPRLRGDLLPENFSQNGPVQLVVPFHHPRLRQGKGRSGPDFVLKFIFHDSAGLFFCFSFSNSFTKKNAVYTFVRFQLFLVLFFSFFSRFFLLVFFS